MTSRARFTATVEPELLDAGRAAVERGEAPSLSAWVNEALQRQAEHDRRLQALDVFISEYEAQHGEITTAEIDAASRRARSRARVVRGAAPAS